MKAASGAKAGRISPTDDNHRHVNTWLSTYCRRSIDPPQEPPADGTTAVAINSSQPDPAKSHFKGGAGTRLEASEGLEQRHAKQTTGELNEISTLDG